MDAASLLTPRNLIIGGVAVVGGLFIANFAFKPKQNASAGPPISQTVVRDPSGDQADLDRNRPPSPPPPAGGDGPPGVIPLPKAPRDVLPILQPAPRRDKTPGLPPVPNPPTRIISPQPAPAPISYPGNVALNCSATDRSMLGDFSAVVRTQQSKGPHLGSGAFLWRNVAAIACYGTPSPWLNRGDWSDPAAINRRRVAHGLFPLTTQEITSMLSDIGSRSGRGLENEADARALFDRWNRPYQCGVHR